jgi:uncharacterized Zn finger protein (UPF0148 family)
MIICLCPFCKSVLVFPNPYKGQESLCPNCQRSLSVPAEPLSHDDVEQILRLVRRAPDDTVNDGGDAKNTDAGKE